MERHKQIVTVTLNPSIDTLYKMNVFQFGMTNRSAAPKRSAGGKGLNVTRVIRQLGEEVTATGFLGGEAGRFIRSELSKVGVQDAFVEINDETRTCLAFVDSLGSQTEVLEYGPTIGEREIELFKQRFSELIGDAGLVVVSGSLPKGLTSDITQFLLEESSRHGVNLLLDTSGQTLIDCLPFKPFMIKPNLEELQQISSETLDDEAKIWKAIEALQEKDIPLVIVTNGAKGAYVSYRGKKMLLTTPAIDVISAVGSGDSFVAGIAVGIARNHSIEKTLTLASACGAANAMEQSTGFIQLELVQQLERQVRCLEL